MTERNFGVRLDLKRFQKLERHLEQTRLNKRAFMELTIDNIQDMARKGRGNTHKLKMMASAV